VGGRLRFAGESDREGLRKARELVGAGHVAGVFVEGTRQRFGYPGPVHEDAVTIAMKEGVPVIPCGVESFGWSRRNRRSCCVVYGDPLRLDELPAMRRGFKAAPEILRLEILALWRQAAEAIAAGFPPELPDGVERRNWPRVRDFHAAPIPRRVSGLA
jgi:1-acyl-sn-glycerol-3-phosphate acyltransferase